MDVYDKAVAYLSERPDAIPDNWIHGFAPDGDWPAGILFGACASRPNNTEFSFLTQIRNGGNAETVELTMAILGDDRLPRMGGHITVDHLPVFADWQRRLDKELVRTPPEWQGPETPQPRSALER